MISKYTHIHQIPKNSMRIVRKFFKGKSETHTHDYFEIEYIVSGNGIYIIDGISYKISPNMLFYMTPANIHTVICDNIDMITIMVKDGSEFKNLSENYCALKLNKQDSKLYESLCTELLSNEHNYDISTQVLQLILTKIYMLSDNKKNSENDPLKKSVIYILNNFKKNITLSEVAEYAGLTPTYFSSLFKKANNITFKQYTDNLKFEYAKKLLLNSQDNIYEICKESGFNSYENFIRRFTERYGISPYEYKKSQTN